MPGIDKDLIGIVNFGMVQDNKVVEEEWSLLAVDQVLANFGGYMSLVWAVVGGFMGGY